MNDTWMPHGGGAVPPAWRRTVRATMAAVVLGASAAAAAAAAPPDVFRGICNASAGVALDAARFIVADDEKSVMKVYRFDGAPAIGKDGKTQDIDLEKHLGDGEADLEGATLVGDTLWLIASHGAAADGSPAPDRRVLLALRLRPAPKGPGADKVAPVASVVGQPYRRLLEDLAGTLAEREFHLADAALIAPKAEGGLSIEGLAATPNGWLLIGLRNPVRNGKAVLLQLENPADVVQGKRARFGPPIPLDLGGKGIRSIERRGTDYFIVAGPTGPGKDFGVYRWSGQVAAAPTPLTVPALEGLNPEALFFDHAGTMHILSDDGKDQPGGIKCKKLAKEQRQFRHIAVPAAGYR